MKKTRKEKLIDYIYNNKNNVRSYICNGKQCQSVHYPIGILNKMTYLDLCEIVEWIFKENIFEVLDNLNIKYNKK